MAVALLATVVCVEAAAELVGVALLVYPEKVPTGAPGSVPILAQ